MEKLFEIASSVSTPLGLGGLFAAILFYIFKQILTKDFVRQMTTTHSAEVIKLIIDRLFILALVAMILGFVAYLLTKIISQSPVTPPVIQKTTDLGAASGSQPSALDHLNNEQRYELITLAQNGCYFFVPGEAKIYSVTEYIELAQDKFAEQLAGSDATILISGYIETGYSSMNAQKLSERRADTVKQILIGKYGIAANRIYAEGHGMKHNQKWVREYFCGARVSVVSK